MSLLNTAQDINSANIESNVRKQVKEVVRAYRHSWDIFSELIQNSVDAINRRFRIINDPEFYLYKDFQSTENLSLDPQFTGKIRIFIDVSSKTIEIQDNGVGIEPNVIEKLLLPDQSGKLPGREYGFKGYGLTFVAFASKYFYINTRFFTPDSQAYEFGLENLFEWMIDDSKPFPSSPIPDCRVASIQNEEPSQYNTVVRVTLDDQYSLRFPAISALDTALNFLVSSISIGSNASPLDAFEYVLRTRTAIGNTHYLFGKSPIVPIEVEIEVVHEDGNISGPTAVPYRFYHPKEHTEVDFMTYEFADYVQKLVHAGFDRSFRGLYHGIKNQVVGEHRSKKITCNFALFTIASTSTLR